MKRIILCCDGTWNTADAKYPTNVVKLARSLNLTGDDGVNQVIHYDDGVGSEKGTLTKNIDRILGGAFGYGLMDKVESSYRFLCENYDPGDEIYIFGFSRGAYTARSLAGLVRNCGIRPHYSAQKISDAINLYKDRKEDTAPDAPDSLKFRAAYSPEVYMNELELEWRKKNVPGFDESAVKPLTIRYIGVWDTVGALGLPNHFFISGLFNGKYKFHSTDLSHIVDCARHAVSIDEQRQSYEPALWTNLDRMNREKSVIKGDNNAPYQQVWFPGNHTAVGGGGQCTGLCSDSFLWVAEGARKLGLSFNRAALGEIESKINVRDPLMGCGSPGLLSKIMTHKSRTGPASIVDVSEAAIQRWNLPAEELPEKVLYRPKPLSRVAWHMSR